jgi:hypothetical protein
MDVPLVQIYEARRLPKPIVRVERLPSHLIPDDYILNTRKELELGTHGSGGLNNVPTVVVHDMLLSGATVCAVLDLLQKSGVDQENTTVIVVAEFPSYRGRQLIRDVDLIESGSKVFWSLISLRGCIVGETTSDGSYEYCWILELKDALCSIVYTIGDV